VSVTQVVTMWKKYKNTLYVILNPFVSLRIGGAKNLMNAVAYKFQILGPPPGRGAQNDILRQAVVSTCDTGDGFPTDEAD
jgi:hypothetical protein